jgi:hypothetical protein
MPKRSEVERFTDKFQIDENGCWIWVGAFFSNGYGNFGRRREGKPVNQCAHRTAYELFTGPIDEGLDLDHLCRVRACVNPEHLEPVSRSENLMRADTVASRYAARTHCGHGHPFSGDNLVIRSGARACLECERASTRRAQQKRRERKDAI